MCASVISGSSRVASGFKNENGNSKIGIAMPFSAPNWARLSSRLPKNTSRQAGTRMFSTVRSALSRQRPPSTGATMCHIRPVVPAGRYGRAPPYRLLESFL